MYSSVDKRDVASSFPFSSEAERKKFLFHNQSHKIDSVPQFFTHSFAVDFRDQLGKVSFEVHFGIICGLGIICGTVHFTTDLPGARSRVSTQMTHSNWSNLMGRFPFTQNFRNFRFGGKWNTFRRFVPLENSQKKWKI